MFFRRFLMFESDEILNTGNNKKKDFRAKSHGS